MFSSGVVEGVTQSIIWVGRYTVLPTVSGKRASTVSLRSTRIHRSSRTGLLVSRKALACWASRSHPSGTVQNPTRLTSCVEDGECENVVLRDDFQRQHREERL